MQKGERGRSITVKEKSNSRTVVQTDASPSDQYNRKVIGE